MTENITVRLAKAALEFNVGKTTIVEFLRKKGFKEVEDNPNYKLSPDMYKLLEKEYQSDKTKKIEAEKLGKDHFAKPTVTIDDIKTKADNSYSRNEFNEEDELRIKVVSGKFEIRTARQKDKPAHKPAETQKPADVPVTEPQPVAEPQPVPETLTIEPVVEPEIQVGSFIHKDIIPSEADKKVLLDLIPEITEPEPETPEPEVQPLIQELSEPEIPVVIEEIPVEKESPEQPEIPAVQEIEEEITSETEISQEKPGLKVVGKIDLDSLNLKTKPAKKTREERKKELEQKRQQEKTRKPADIQESIPEKPVETIEPVKTEPEKQPEPKPVIKKEEPSEASQPATVSQPSAASTYPDNFIKTEFRKLEGLTIVGKIELPGDKADKRKPVASSSDDKIKSNRKKKRKRLKTREGEESKPATDQKPAGGTPSQPPADKKPGKDLVKTKLPPRGKQLIKEAPKVEISEKDIAEIIKETHQRLTQHKKSKAEKIRREKRRTYLEAQEEEMKKHEEESKILKVTEYVTANDLATMLNVPVTKIISTCMSLGLFVSINQRIDAETISLLAEEFGAKVEFVSIEVMEALETEEEKDAPEDLVHRAPVVTVMGHVDHGKTKLLDYVRHTNVVAGEAGGITQHIGSYEVQLEGGKKISFLDTPGHEAFTAMRARGAKVTDVAIIVIAAEDNVRPQTVEAINHAQAAGVPIVFAINKIDLPTANPEKIKQQLAQMNILIEEYGGKYQCQEISAKSGLNVDELLEKVLLEAEMLDLKANPKRNAYGTVIESSLDKGRGYVAKILVQNGTLNIGDMVLAGTTFGRVKAMYNERNILVKSAGPSTPVLLLGLNGAPQAGDKFNVMTDEKEVKEIALKRLQLQREQGLRTQKHITLDEIGRRIAKGDFKELNIIVKGDVDGSVEALSDSLLRLSNDEVQVNVIHKSVGSITESDVLLASASNAIIIGFQVRPSVAARKLAEKEQIDIRLYSIIYSAINELKAAIEGMLSPEIEEKITSNLEVRQVFKINKVGTIAGCLVLDGKITRNAKVRVIRDGIVVFTGQLGSLKRFKDDVKEASAGQECGLNVDKFDDIREKDIIESYEMTEIARKL